MSRLELTAEAAAKLADLLKHLRGRKVGVLGLGISGKAMAHHLLRHGATVLAADNNIRVRVDELRSLGCQIQLGATDASTFANVEGLAISPGADSKQPAVQAVLDKGLPVFGELELCGSLPAKVAAVTGTNGKSTTTALLGTLVEGLGQRTFVGGNLGDPIVGWLDSGRVVDAAIVELSSYQLETAYHFRADVAVLLNLQPDHVERYASMHAYGLAKRRLIENQSADGIAVLNRDDAAVVDMAKHAGGRIWWFSTNDQPFDGDGAFLSGDQMVPCGALQSFGPIDLYHERLFGRHNRENALAAILATWGLMGPQVQREDLLRAYRSFRGLEHRLEWVGESRGITFINDSKATNDQSAAVAVAALQKPIVLLVGGRDKHAGYSELLRNSKTKVRSVIAFGEARHVIAQAFAGHHDVHVCEKMQNGFEEATRLAQPGDVVLLSPACSSFDEFENYAHRGRVFKTLVRDYVGGQL